MIAEIKSLLKEKKSFLITTHVDPDGDAIGSAFAMYFFLRQLGKSAQVYLKDSVPYRYAFLPGPDRIEKEIERVDHDAVLVLDCGDLKRIGEARELIATHALIVNIDHHDTSEMFGRINYVNVKASSTCEILYDIFKSFHIDFNYEIAVNIYTGIFTDTGSLRFQNTTQRAFQICGEMVGFGVSPRFVAEMVYENHPKERFLLLSEVLKTLELTEGGKLAIVTLTSQMFEKTGSKYEHSDGFVEYVKELGGIKVAVLIRELEKGKCKISMRSKNDTDVGRLCHKLGGGGHKNAAGCILQGKLEEIKELIIRTVSEAL